jgi:hypothetical protein
MIVRVDVRIDAEPSDNPSGSYGALNFSEQMQFSGAGFGTVSKIFTRCHELLAVMKQEHDISSEGLKRR